MSLFFAGPSPSWQLSLRPLVVPRRNKNGNIDALSGSNTPARATPPAQLASYRPDAVQPPPGDYQATPVSASRSAPAAKRFQLPKCLTSS